MKSNVIPFPPNRKPVDPTLPPDGHSARPLVLLPMTRAIGTSVQLKAA